MTKTQGNGKAENPEITEFFDVDKWNGLTRWAPWEWMVYEFEHGLARPKPTVYPKPPGLGSC